MNEHRVHNHTQSIFDFEKVQKVVRHHYSDCDVAHARKQVESWVPEGMDVFTWSIRRRCEKLDDCSALCDQGACVVYYENNNNITSPHYGRHVGGNAQDKYFRFENHHVRQHRQCDDGVGGGPGTQTDLRVDAKVSGSLKLQHSSPESLQESTNYYRSQSRGIKNQTTSAEVCS